MWKFQSLCGCILSCFENCQKHTFSVEIGRGCWSLKDHKLLTLSSVLFIVMEILKILKVLEEIEKMEKSIRCQKQYTVFALKKKAEKNFCLLLWRPLIFDLKTRAFWLENIFNTTFSSNTNYRLCLLFFTFPLFYFLSGKIDRIFLSERASNLEIQII